MRPARSAVIAVLGIITLFVLAVFAGTSGTGAGAAPAAPSRTVTVTATATVTAPGPTTTATVPGPTTTVTVPGPTTTVTVSGPTSTVTVPGPTQTVTAPGPTVTATSTVTATATQTVTETVTVTATPTPAPADELVRIGMSAPAGEWPARVTEVGTQGLKARRIFADLTAAGNDQATLITQAVNDGMMPVVSYKVPSVTNAINGSYDAWANAAAAYLASFDVPVAVTIWHEPRGDMTAAQFVSLQNRLVPRFKGVGKLRVGPILNSFLLTQPSQPAGVNEFASFTSPSLLRTWDWFGIDTYQPGTQSAPGAILPHERLVALEDWLDSQGVPDLPIGVGEYNGFSAAAISGMGDTLLSMPEVWFGCVWNVDEARAGILTGSRLTAYKATKADPRAQQ